MEPWQWFNLLPLPSALLLNPLRSHPLPLTPLPLLLLPLPLLLSRTTLFLQILPLPLPPFILLLLLLPPFPYLFLFLSFFSSSPPLPPSFLFLSRFLSFLLCFYHDSLSSPLSSSLPLFFLLPSSLPLFLSFSSSSSSLPLFLLKFQVLPSFIIFGSYCFPQHYEFLSKKKIMSRVMFGRVKPSILEDISFYSILFINIKTKIHKRIYNHLAIYLIKN